MFHLRLYTEGTMTTATAVTPMAAVLNYHTAEDARASVKRAWEGAKASGLLTFGPDARGEIAYVPTRRLIIAFVDKGTEGEKRIAQPTAEETAAVADGPKLVLPPER